MLRWIYGVKLRQHVGIKDIVQRNVLQWNGHVLRNDGDWMKNVLLWRLREPYKGIGPGNTGRGFDKDVNDLHLKTK